MEETGHILDLVSQQGGVISLGGRGVEKKNGTKTREKNRSRNGRTSFDANPALKNKRKDNGTLRHRR
jgi:hypothetical protein